MTEEFFDLEARIKNKKVEEARLVKHLTDSTGKLEDILAVEREISRVRQEIEHMEGRIRLIANLAELTSVQRHRLRADRASSPRPHPSFATRASRTLHRIGTEVDRRRFSTLTLQGHLGRAVAARSGS